MPKPLRVILQLETKYEFGRQIMSGIAEYSRQCGPWTFHNMEFKEDDPWVFRERFLHRKGAKTNPRDVADGIIMRDAPENDCLSEIELPKIIVCGFRPPPQHTPSIEADSMTIGKIGARHLLDKGFQNVGYCGVHGDKDYYWSRERGEIFTAEIEKAGCHVHLYRTLPDRAGVEYWEEELERIGQWLRDLPKPLAIMTCNDIRATHVLEACKIAELRVPEEVAVLGVDNDPLICGLAEWPLSSVSLNSTAAGFEAAKILHKMMRGRKVKNKVIRAQASHVVTRQSTDVLAVKDTEVADAVKYIQDNLRHPIQVADVAEAVGLSRRALEIRFRNALRRSVLEEIKRVRLEEVKRLLVNTDYSISQIATRLGYSSEDHISRYFKTQMDISLQEFRKKYKFTSGEDRL